MLAALRLLPYAAIAALVIAFLLQRGNTLTALRQADTFKAQVTERDRYIEQANGVITNQNATIADLQNQIVRDGEMIAALHVTIQSVQAAAEDSMRAIEQAGKDDESVDSWMRTAVPDRVRDELNKAAAGR